ncbi:hypothetical protein Hanom_Chr04g00286291 [Helianthus anomalus]
MKLTFLVVMLRYKKNSHLNLKILKLYTSFWMCFDMLMLEVVKFRYLNVRQALFIYETNQGRPRGCAGREGVQGVPSLWAQSFWGPKIFFIQFMLIKKFLAQLKT